MKQGVTKKLGLKGVQILKRNEDLNLLPKVRGKLPRCILWTEERRWGSGEEQKSIQRKRLPKNMKDKQRDGKG